MRTTRPDANGATITPGGVGSCYAEFGMTGSTGSSTWETTIFECREVGAGSSSGGAAVASGADGEDCSATEFECGDGTGGREENLG